MRLCGRAAGHLDSRCNLLDMLCAETERMTASSLALEPQLCIGPLYNEMFVQAVRPNGELQRFSALYCLLPKLC